MNIKADFCVKPYTKPAQFGLPKVHEYYVKIPGCLSLHSHVSVPVTKKSLKKEIAEVIEFMNVFFKKWEFCTREEWLNDPNRR